MKSRPSWKVTALLPNIEKGILTGKQINDAVKKIRSDPRAIGDLGYCPQYVDENKNYEPVKALELPTQEIILN